MHPAGLGRLSVVAERRHGKLNLRVSIHTQTMKKELRI
jgi:hypothetical protein